MMVWVVTKMVLILGLLCIFLFIAIKLLKRGKVSSNFISSRSPIKILTTQMIAPQKYISIVEICEELFALGISESQINLLTKIEDKELAKKMTEQLESKTSSFFHFQNYLFKNGGFFGILLRRVNEK